MYEEGKKLDINWGSLLIKLAIFALIILVACFIFFKIINNKGSNKANKTLAVDSETFNKNIYTMKDAAFEYFTKSRLPEKAGSTETLTLKDMISEKLIIDFTNEGKSCDLNKSFIQATRTLNDNYALRVDLTCGKRSDYIVATIEKEEICQNNTCSKPVKEEEKKEEVITPPTTNKKEDTTSSSNQSSSSSSSSSSSASSSSSSSSSSSKKQTVTTTTTTTITYKVKCINGCCCCCYNCNK